MLQFLSRERMSFIIHSSAFALQIGVFCHPHKFPTKAEFSMCATFLSPKRHCNIWYSQTSCLIHYSLFRILSEIQTWSERIKKSQIKKLSNHTFINNINKSESPYAGIQESKLHDYKLTHNRNSTKPRIKGAHFQWVIATTSNAWFFLWTWSFIKCDSKHPFLMLPVNFHILLETQWWSGIHKKLCCQSSPPNPTIYVANAQRFPSQGCTALNQEKMQSLP